MIDTHNGNTACALTIIQAQGRRLAKLVHADGRIGGYDRARTVTLHPRSIAHLTELHRLLDAIAGRQDCCVVRGEPVNPNRLHGLRRLSRPDPETGEAATLREVPRRWVALDLDGLPLPAGADPADLAACTRAVLPRLPVAFQGVACIVQATGSHAIKPGARLRLWYWLSRATSGTELKVWLRGVPADVSVFRCAQPIYVATPIFAAGARDPLPRRLAFLPGAEAVHVPAADQLTPRPKPIARLASLPAPGRGGRYASAALIRATAAIHRGDDGRHLVAVREAMGLARLVRAGLLTRGEVERAIAGALDVPGRGTIETEAADIVSWAMDNADDRALPEGVRP